MAFDSLFLSHEHDHLYKCGWLSLCFAFLVSFELSFDIKGELKPDEAMKALTIFEGKFSRLKEERENVAKAKEALELSEPGNFVNKKKRCLKIYLHMYIMYARLFFLHWPLMGQELIEENV